MNQKGLSLHVKTAKPSASLYACAVLLVIQGRVCAIGRGASSKRGLHIPGLPLIPRHLESCCASHLYNLFDLHSCVTLLLVNSH